MPFRRLPILLLALPLLAACRGKEGAWHTTKASADPTPEEEAAIAAAPGALTATGQVTYRGASSFFCVPHAEEGFQVDFRTSSAEMPAVAVRIERYQGSGPYPMRLFVTGRSSTGALVTSTGEGKVEIQQRDPAAGEAAAIVSGTFQGQYDGEAGKGAIEGRFASCNYSRTRGGASPPVAGAVSATGSTDEEQPAGAAEENHERPSNASRLSARSRAGVGGSRNRSAASGRRGRRARSPHGGGRSRGRRGHGAGVRGAG